MVQFDGEMFNRPYGLFEPFSHDLSLSDYEKSTDQIVFWSCMSVLLIIQMEYREYVFYVPAQLFVALQL